jgi:phospholipid/cholesterol/gamma-HCH transport system substrate-binding protein
MDQYVRHLRWAELKVGIIVSAALVVFFFAVLFAGRGIGLFERQATIRATFNDVGGLQAGAPVRFSGLDVGKVESLTLGGPGKITATISVQRRAFEYLKSDSTAVIGSLDFFGDMYVSLTVGSPEARPLQPGSTIGGSLEMGLQEIARTARGNLSSLASLTEKIDRLALMLETGQGTLPRLIRDPALYESMEKATARLASIIDRLDQGQGSLGLLMKDDSLYRSLSSLATGLEQYTKTLKDSQGTLNKLIADPSLYRRFDEAAGKLNAIMDRLDKGQGTLGNLLKNEEAWKELTKALNDFSLLLEDVKKNPKKYFNFSVF